MPVAVSQGHAVGTPQANAADMPQGQMSQFTPQVLERMDRLEAGMREVVDRLERLERRMAPHLDAACTPQIYSSSWEI